MPKPTDYEDEPPTHVETPLPTRYDADTRSYHFCDEDKDLGSREHGAAHHDRGARRSLLPAPAGRRSVKC